MLVSTREGSLEVKLNKQLLDVLGFSWGVDAARDNSYNKRIITKTYKAN